VIPEIHGIERCRADVRATMLGLAEPVEGQWIELLEEVEGRHCAAWLEAGRVVTGDGWLTSDAETLARIGQILVADDIEIVLVYTSPNRYEGSRAPVLTDLVVSETLRPPHEVRAAAELSGLRAVMPVYSGPVGMDEDRALSMLAVNGVMGSRTPVDRLRCWLTYRGLPIECATIERAKELKNAKHKPVLPDPFAATAGDRAATAALAQALVSARGGKRKRAARGTLEAHEPVSERGDGLRLPGL